ncbi:LIM and calponin homology domains-containing protein 1 isoform X2 [Trichomycterus rosablanca]|uniref:LIM and calponin homology domains-containing protein 1 isoform X2 n=1 Tax=Trichomycterus rosablanca TaxID=2290929 RepID=UPI002F358FAC
MASSDADLLLHPQHPLTDTASEPALREAQRWIEAVTGRSIGERDLRGGLDNGILLCELLSKIKPGLEKKINRLQTPLAGQDNLTLFLKGCEELGLKGSQLFDPGDLQDPRTNKGSDCNKRLKHVLITIYWLGRAANNCATYNGPTLDLREFEGLLSQMRKEGEDLESPKRSIRDSGYIDSWESERSESLSPPRHTRDDSFDSLDSVGSRSRHTPSPDGLFARCSSDGRGSDSECEVPLRRVPDIRRDDMLARRTSCSEPRTAVPFNQYLPNKSNQTSYMPVPLRKQRGERDENCKSWSNATSPVGGERHFRFCRRDSVFDDPESVSMIDVRNEENGMLSPHSQIRHELIHGQYHRLKDEDNQWQDDLAKWKSRRRSVSQDLIKKEEERKTMERLMSVDEESQRRKSIKTYREIVEEKELREKELYAAYQKARTPEEAAAVLQHYSQRFTISEAIMEQLKLPPLLERSVSADPTRHSDHVSSSSTSSPNPLRYLRQQSLPAPKFTATVEARVPGYDMEQGIMGNGGGGSGGARSGRSVSLLGPKPLRHDRGTKDAMVRVNGGTEKNHDTGEKPNGGMDSHREEQEDKTSEGDSSPLLFYPSPDQNTESDSTDMKTSDAPSTSIQEPSEPATRNLNLEQLKRAETKTGPGPERSREDDTQKGGPPTRPTYMPTVTKPALEPTERPENQRVPFSPEKSDPSSGPGSSVTEPVEKQHRNVAPVVLNLVKRGEHFSWDPEEERKRQARWQQEQERALQEKYNREQEKLKQEWEKAQKEVEAEERRYHEEERKILEETVAPLTPHSPIPTSPFPVTLHSKRSQHSIVRSLADWERKQEELEKQMKKTLEKKKQSANVRSETSESPQQQNCVNNRQTEGTGEQNQGPNQLQTNQDVSLSSKQHQQQKQNSSPDSQQKSTSQDSIKNNQPAPGGRKRSGSVENAGSKSPQPTSYTDTQQPPPSPNRSVSGKKQCSSCGLPLGKGAAMIIETLSLYFHIQCFKCGICKAQLGDTSAGTDVRIRNGLLNCNQCYIRSRSAGQPTNL